MRQRRLVKPYLLAVLVFTVFLASLFDLVVFAFALPRQKDFTALPSLRV